MSLKPSRIQILLVAQALLLAGVSLYLNRGFYHDDAFISLRYAAHWLAGQGVVWNPGELVQGYTNFLFLALTTLLAKTGLDLVLATRLVSGAAFLTLGVLVWKMTPTLLPSWPTPARHLAATLVWTASPLLVWVTGGLEGPLFALAVTGQCLVLLRAGGRPSHLAVGGTLAGLAFLVRPDGALFGAVSLGWLVLARDPARARRPHGWALFLAAAAAVVLPYLVWQQIYYGELIPNTFHAKSGSPLGPRLVSGLRYLISYASTPPFLPLLVALSLARTLGKRRWNGRLTYLVLLVLAQALYILWTGGDAMPAYRFLVPIVPLLGILLVLSLSLTVEARRTGPLTVLMAAVMALTCLQPLDPRLNPGAGDATAAIGAIVGKYIEEAWPPGSLVALNTAGSTPYHAPSHRFIDMLGLNDAVISRRTIDHIQLRWQRIPGHRKGDGRYVLSRRPDYIIIGPAEGTVADDPWFLSDLELNADPEFHRLYALNRTVLDDQGRATEGPGLPFTYYALKRQN